MPLFPMNWFALGWCVNVALMIFPEEFTIHVATITIKMMFLIATDASIDPTPFII